MKRQPYILFVVLLLALMPVFQVASAQEDMPQVAPPEDGPVGVLAEFQLDELPTPHAEVWFLRMQLEPDGSLPESPQIGPVVVYVESGQLTLESDVELAVDTDETARFDETATPDGMQRTVLETGNSAMIPAGAVLSANNASDEPVTFLVVMMYAAELEGTMEETGEPVGLTQSLLSAGRTEFPPITGKVTIERVEIPADEPTTGMLMAGVELGVVEQGQGIVTFTSFERNTMIWPNVMEAYSDSVNLQLTGSTELTAGDGYVTAGTATMWIPMGDPIVVLRVVAGPDMMP